MTNSPQNIIETALAQQIDYYRARAAEYDQWWHREGRYDRGEADNARPDHDAVDIVRHGQIQICGKSVTGAMDPEWRQSPPDLARKWREKALFINSL
ncbi:MAG: hypothetical protein IID55_11620 [Proteobacteria bacterium]|nr:hypothetical protein [Pseudomonadota bacterium]